MSYIKKVTLLFYFLPGSVPTTIESSLTGQISVSGATLNDVASDLVNNGYGATVSMGATTPLLTSGGSYTGDLLEVVVEQSGLSTIEVPFTNHALPYSNSVYWGSLRRRITGSVDSDANFYHADAMIEFNYDIANDPVFDALKQAHDQLKLDHDQLKLDFDNYKVSNDQAIILINQQILELQSNLGGSTSWEHHHNS